MGCKMVKLHVAFIKHHTMKAYVVMKVYLHSFLTYALDGDCRYSVVVCTAISVRLKKASRISWLSGWLLAVILSYRQEAIVTHYKALPRNIYRGTEEEHVKCNQTSWFPHWDSNSGPSGFKAIVLMAGPRRYWWVTTAGLHHTCYFVTLLLL
jgi:hypothetical protein